MKSSLISVASLCLAFAPLALHAQAEPDPHPRTDPAEPAAFTKLIALIRPVGSDSKVMGTVVFDKASDGVKITAKIGGLVPNASHGFHIHQFGDLASDDASSAGEHFNPDNHEHATLDKDMRHSGDLGNLVADGSGNAVLNLTVKNITLDSGMRGILGRAVIVHEKADDGSQPSGNAGKRIGAGVIGISKDTEQKTAAVVTPAPSKPEDKDTPSPAPAPKSGE